MGVYTQDMSTSNRATHMARHLQPSSTAAAAQVDTSSAGVFNEPGFSGSYAGDYKIRDLSLSVRGRKELSMAEVEMPGLMNCRQEFGESKPLAGARVMGSLHMTVQTAVLMETLHAMGADVRWATCNIFSTQDEAAAACVQSKSACVYAWKGQSIAEYWECMDATITWDDGEGMDIIVDDGGDVLSLSTRALPLSRSLQRILPTPQILPPPITRSSHVCWPPLPSHSRRTQLVSLAWWSALWAYPRRPPPAFTACR